MGQEEKEKQLPKQGKTGLHWGWERKGNWVRCPFNQWLGRDEK